VPTALDLGYRNFDTALRWESEKFLGVMLGQAVNSGNLKREDVFISTKVCHPVKTWSPGYDSNPKLGFDFENLELDVKKCVNEHIQESLQNLGVDYVDLLLMHWPGNYNSQNPRNRAVRKQIWEVFESIHKAGVAKAIGKCNFAVHHMKSLSADSCIKPIVAHIEGHPYGIDEDMVSFCKDNDMAMMAIAPFASGCLNLFKDPVLSELSIEYGCSVGQLILRWLRQRGLGVLPKSGNHERMASNLDLDFEIQ